MKNEMVAAAELSGPTEGVTLHQFQFQARKTTEEGNLRTVSRRPFPVPPTTMMVLIARPMKN